jgi:hypothetical protein
VLDTVEQRYNQAVSEHLRRHAGQRRVQARCLDRQQAYVDRPGQPRRCVCGYVELAELRTAYREAGRVQRRRGVRSRHVHDRMAGTCEHRAEKTADTARAEHRDTPPGLTHPSSQPRVDAGLTHQAHSRRLTTLSAVYATRLPHLSGTRRTGAVATAGQVRTRGTVST